jgi:hypothetical protein
VRRRLALAIHEPERLSVKFTDQHRRI